MRKLTALFSVIVLMVGILALPITSYAYWNHGKVRIVSRGEDLKVRIVERGEDFTIRWVDRNPGGCKGKICLPLRSRFAYGWRKAIALC